MRYYFICIAMISILFMCPPDSDAGFWDIFKIDRGSIEISNENSRIKAVFGYEDRRHVQRYYSHKRKGK